jgi:hypothetical protein
MQSLPFSRTPEQFQIPQSSKTGMTALQQLLQALDVEELGEGDSAAGTNVLAAMCASLTNLASPGAALLNANGDRLSVGMNFAVIGGLSDSLINDKVLNPIAAIQNNLADHLAASVAHEVAVLAAKPEHERARIRPAAPSRKPAMSAVDTQMNGISLVRDSSAFLLLLEPCQGENINGLSAAPLVFFHACNSRDVENALQRTHRQYPYIRTTLPDDAREQGLEQALLSIIRGTGVSEGLACPVSVRGHVVATCTSIRLAHWVRAGEQGLLGNLCWLVDGDYGAAEPRIASPADPPPFPTHSFYLKALQRVWAERLDYRRIATPSLSHEWNSLQRRWIDHLRQLENWCPGITQAARPLVATLIYGLFILCGIAENGKKPKWLDEGILELAKLLAGRMARYRELLTSTEEDNRLLTLAEKLIKQLAQGPLDPRCFVRDTPDLADADGREVFQILERLALVSPTSGGKKWQLTLPQAQAAAKLRQRYVDV